MALAQTGISGRVGSAKSAEPRSTVPCRVATRGPRFWTVRRPAVPVLGRSGPVRAGSGPVPGRFPDSQTGPRVPVVSGARPAGCGSCVSCRALARSRGLVPRVTGRAGRPTCGSRVVRAARRRVAGRAGSGWIRSASHAHLGSGVIQPHEQLRVFHGACLGRT